MKDGLTPVTNQNVSGSVSNNLSKLEKEHYALQRYARRSNVEILGYQISLLGIVWRKKLLNYVMMLVLLLKSETLNLVIDCFKKKVTISCPTLPGKCPELFWVILVRIFPHSDWIWRDTPHLSVFSTDAGKCGTEQLRIRTPFTQCKRTIVRFVNKRSAEDLISKRKFFSTLDFNKLRFPRGTRIYFNANLCTIKTAGYV